jgi:hypothetical protein
MVCVPVETTSFSVFMLINANRIGRTAPARMIESSMRVPSTNRIVGAGISTFDGGGSTQARAHAIPRTERKHMFEKIQQHRCATEGVLGCLYNSSTNNGNASTRSISSKLSATTLKVTIRLKLMHALSHTQTFITTKRYQSRARFYNGIQRIIARNKVLYCASCARDSSIDGAEFVAMCCVPIRGTISKLLAGNAAGNAMAY